MPSFDIVSQLDKHQLTNAIDQANRIVTTRFDFKGVNAKFTKQEDQVLVEAEAEFQIEQMLEILRAEMSKKSIDIKCLEYGKIEESNKAAKTSVKLREGIEQDLAKKITTKIKAEKLKVQAQIQGDQVRVTGKKRDDLQSVIALLKQEDLDMPLQFINFRD